MNKQERVEQLSNEINEALGPRPTIAARRTRENGMGGESRYYDIPGVGELPSVTTILNCINKPYLIDWAARVEREMVTRVSADLYQDLPLVGKKMSRLAYLTTLDQRIGKGRAHRRLLKEAGDIGTAVHALIEWNMRCELKQEVGQEPRLPDGASWAFACYQDWRSKANLSPIMLEQVVYSRRYGYAGTMDLACDIDNPNPDEWGPQSRVHVVADYKTSRTISSEALLQNAAYVHALVEMGLASPDIGGMVVRFPKREGEYFETVYISPERQKRLFKVFLAAKEIWQYMSEAK